MTRNGPGRKPVKCNQHPEPSDQPPDVQHDASEAVAPLLEQLKREQQEARARQERDESRDKKRQRLLAALRSAESFAVEAPVRVFARQWAPHWLEAGRAMTECAGISTIRDLSLPPGVDYELARQLVEEALKAPPIGKFTRRLATVVEALMKGETPGRSGNSPWPLRSIFGLLKPFVLARFDAHQGIATQPLAPLASEPGATTTTASQADSKQAFALKEIDDRGLTASQRDRVVKAYGQLMALTDEWVPRASLDRLGLNPKTIDADSAQYSAVKLGDQRTGPVRFKRTYLLAFVLKRWKPRSTSTQGASHVSD